MPNYYYGGVLQHLEILQQQGYNTIVYMGTETEFVKELKVQMNESDTQADISSVHVKFAATFEQLHACLRKHSGEKMIVQGIIWWLKLTDKKQFNATKINRTFMAIESAGADIAYLDRTNLNTGIVLCPSSPVNDDTKKPGSSKKDSKAHTGEIKRVTVKLRDVVSKLTVVVQPKDNL